MAQQLRLSPSISTTVRFMTTGLLRRAAFRTSATVAPRLARLWAEQMFLTPPRPRHLQNRFFDFLDAKDRVVEHRGRMIATWSWGPRSAPAVVLVHGWGGAAVQMRPLVFPLLAAGFRVLAFDQPAHGLSQGELSGLPDFASALAEVAKAHDGVVAAVGHSLGAASVAVAAANGLSLRRIVLLSPPADPVTYSRRFARWNWIPERVRERMQAATEERFGVRWNELSMERLAPRLRAEALVIHDRDDRVVPHRQGERIAERWPGARLLSTTGRGHYGLLEDEAITEAIADFIAGRSKVATLVEARPPASIY